MAGVAVGVSAAAGEDIVCGADDACVCCCCEASTDEEEEKDDAEAGTGADPRFCCCCCLRLTEAGLGKRGEGAVAVVVEVAASVT